MSFYEFAMYFLIYGFVGWCVEVIYYTVDSGKFVNRGFLNGPVCPIYGFGFTAVIICLTPLKDNVFVLFLGSVALTTLLELVTGFVLEKIFHEHWWDYNDEAFNFKGYICVKFSLMWGLACTFAMLVVHPIFERLINHVPRGAGWITIIVSTVLYLADVLITVLAIAKIYRSLSVIREITTRLRKVSDKVGEEISDATLDIMEKSEKGKQELEELRKKHKELSEKPSYVAKRIRNAFPKLKLDRQFALGAKLKAKLASINERKNKQ